ncbi:MAG TPA: DUF4439 domain-containing protein [Jatrophihabitans sp.]|jgi:hypothetical protein|uniref:DUF4439 domain-containing protein n=1 Tax=Jatrophihabitans sp. TaxID=1932789 RepID=UPI002F0A9E9B
MTAPGQDAVVQALQRVLAAQHAAVFGYPVIGVELRDPGQARLARLLEARHRHTRDELMAQIAARRASPAPAEASYTPAQPVTAPADAQRWALELEQDCAAAYRYLLVAPVLAAAAGLKPSGANGSSATGSNATGSNGSGANGSGGPALSAAAHASLRRQALAGLNTAALNATEWRSLLSPATPTVAFPGL